MMEENPANLPQTPDQPLQMYVFSVAARQSSILQTSPNKRLQLIALPSSNYSTPASAYINATENSHT